MTVNIPANIKRNQQGHLCITLEKAGIYRGKQRYTVNEIPDLGATVSPEVEVARWLLVRGADPMDEMAVSYPKGQGFPVELEFQGKPDIALINPNVTTLAEAAHLFRINGWFTLLPLTRIVSEAEFETILEKPFTEGRPDVATKWDDKIGAETRRRLKAEAGILIEDYFDKWRNELAAHLQEAAAKWEDGRNCWRPDYIWKDTKHLGKAAYGAAKAAKLRWEAGRVLQGLADSRTAFCCPAEIRAEFMAKDYEVNLMRLPLRAWIQRRIDKGATLIEACRARLDHEAAKEAARTVKDKAEREARDAKHLRANEYLRANWGLSIPTQVTKQVYFIDAEGRHWHRGPNGERIEGECTVIEPNETFMFEGKQWSIRNARGLVDQSTRKAGEGAPADSTQLAGSIPKTKL